MTPHEAATRWNRRQVRILANAYAQAWDAGANTYRTQHATPLGTSVRKAQPTRPDAKVMGRALGPAIVSLTNMTAALATIVPTAAQISAAGGATAAIAVAMATYLEVNAWRLAGGASVAWAGEQAGYVQAADADGLLLSWQLGGAKPCADCPELAALPPMPLDQWPTLPGEGETECNVGCRCSMVAVGMQAPQPLTAEQQQTLSRIASKPSVLVAA